MKLVMCPQCGDVFKLRHHMRACDCGMVRGRYLDNSRAEVSAEAISIALGNGAVDKAIRMMRSMPANRDRQEYLDCAHITHAWVRPNHGPGNPHTTLLREGSSPEGPRHEVARGAKRLEPDAGGGAP